MSFSPPPLPPPPKYILIGHFVTNKYSHNGTAIFLSATTVHVTNLYSKKACARWKWRCQVSHCFHPLSNSRTLPSYHVMVYLLLWDGPKGRRGKRKVAPGGKKREKGRNEIEKGKGSTQGSFNVRSVSPRTWPPQFAIVTWVDQVGANFYLPGFYEKKSLTLCFVYSISAEYFLEKVLKSGI